MVSHNGISLYCHAADLPGVALLGTWLSHHPNIFRKIFILALDIFAIQTIDKLRIFLGKIGNVWIRKGWYGLEV